MLGSKAVFIQARGTQPYCFILFGLPCFVVVCQCLIKLPTGEYVSPQYGGSWTLESSSLCHHPTTIIALIVNHWEDQFCRDVYQELCGFRGNATLTCHSTSFSKNNPSSLCLDVDSNQPSGSLQIQSVSSEPLEMHAYAH